MLPRIALTEILLPEAMQFLTQNATVDIVSSLNDIYKYDAAITTLSATCDGQFFDNIPAGSPLKIIANYAVGYDNFDIEAARRHNIWVTNTPDVLTEATAELAFALMLGISRRLQEGHALVQSGNWAGWEPTQLLGMGLRGKTLGIVGAGRIGQCMGHLAYAHGMRLLYTSRERKLAFEQRTGACQVTLATLCQESDYVSLHLPGGSQTHHTLNAELLACLKTTAYVINTGRGTLIDEQALIALLKNKQIAGAALDVFEQEPYVPQALRELPNVLLSPHLGSATCNARLAMAQICYANIEAAYQGNRPAQDLTTRL